MTAWLIEKADREHPGCSTGFALGVSDRGKGLIHDLSWTDPDLAIRFCRKEDAENSAIFLVTDVKTIAVEHSWS